MSAVPRILAPRQRSAATLECEEAAEWVETTASDY
jgi:hypothetical protein